MSKVFITGATGFIGGNLVTGLLKRGFEVKILARSQKLIDLHPWKDKVEVVFGDINKPETFEDKVKDCEIFIHDAAVISFWNRQWDKIHKVNVIGTRNVVNAALKANCKRFIQISSVAAIGYGENGEAVNENIKYNWNKLNPKIVYMETKHEAELEVYEGIKKGLNAVMVNPANVWGVGDIRGRRVPVLKVAKLGLPFYVDAGTNFVDVEAVCEATLNAIEMGKAGERFILGGENLEVKDFIGILADELGFRKPFIKIGKTPIVAYTYLQEALACILPIKPKPSFSQINLLGPRIYYDSSKAIRELKMPVIPFKETIRKSIRFYKENGLL